MKTKRIMITGATGFVGANLAHRLLHDGHDVHLLVRKGYTPWRIESIRSEIHLHQVDLGNRETLTTAVKRIQPNWIFHLAACGSYSSQTDLHKMIQTNIVGTVNLVEACLEVGFEAFINTGSSSEYGYKDHAPSEKEGLEPNSHYAVTKSSATLYCRYTAQFKNVHLVTLRPYSVYGSYEEPTRLIPTLILYGLRGGLPSLVNPNVVHDFIYIDDIIDAYLLAASVSRQEPGAIYNVGTGIQTAMGDVVKTARQVLEINVEPNWGSMPDRHWDTHVWVADNKKIREALGWYPKNSFEQGFRLMLNWFHSHPAMKDFYQKYSGLKKDKGIHKGERKS
jgi:nucleoside-diphosphate-sugar epimerase